MNADCDIHWFAERDIDVWLAEELKFNAGFARWFLNKLGQPSSMSVPAYRTRVSVVEGRETDVEALFRTAEGSTFAVLVEDKIKAGFQTNQMEDYVERGKLGTKRGNWSGFAVAVFAPRYRMPFPKALPPTVVALEFEEAAKRIASSEPHDARAIYRARFIERAAQPKVIVAENENQFLAQWWKAVDDLIREQFGDFFVIDRKSFPSTTYVNAKCVNMPAYLRLDLKGDQGEVALAFIGFPLNDLKSLVAPLELNGVVVDQKNRNKDPALRIANLPKFRIDDGLESETMHRVLTSYSAAHKLLSFWKSNRLLFDDAAARLRPAQI